MALVLIVEDAALLRKLLQKILRAKGYSTLEASNGREGLEMISTHHPDCVVLDLLMPEMEGREVLKEMRDRGLQIPTIVMTADIQETTRSECLELGALAVLNKLPKGEELLPWIEKALKVSTEEGIYATDG